MNVLEKLQEWYLSNCDGDWEHSFGVRISTLDNPGWSIDVNLTETRLDGKDFKKITIERSDNDWVHCFIDKGFFKGRCGPNNLIEMLEIFCTWASE